MHGAVSRQARSRLKSDAVIQRAAAKKWAKLARACCREYRATGDLDLSYQAHSHEDEALEHAALVRDYGETVKKIQRELEAAMTTCRPETTGRKGQRKHRVSTGARHG